MSVMWEPLRPQNFQNTGLGCYKNLAEKQQQPTQPWFKSIFNSVIKYKNELFGQNSIPEVKKQRVQDYTIPVNYKFVLALFCDGFYRPGAVVGKNRKQQQFVVYFYHTKKCCYVKRKHIVLKHGNLIGKKVFFCHCGQKKKAKVFGNNSPANNGFPSIFFLKQKDTWFKIPFKSVFLSKKMVHKCNQEIAKGGKSDHSLASTDVFQS